MKRSIASAFLVFSFFLTPAFAKQAIVLQPYSGEASPRIAAQWSMKGQCGESEVLVLGIRDTYGDFFSTDLDAGQIIIRHPSGRQLAFGTDSPLMDDHSGLACISGKNGHRLLFWNNCAGSVCGEDWSFFILDLKRLRFLAPANIHRGSCDKACAIRWLGASFPAWLR